MPCLRPQKRQTQQRVAAFGPLEVERDAPLVAVHHQEGGRDAADARLAIGARVVAAGYTYNKTNDKITTLTDSNQDEKPSFAPNSKLIMYATKAKSNEVLMTVTLDGKIGTKLAGQSANIREPHWGPFLKP
jgi:hypothetical protein